jgi:hypothetical protein
MNTYQMLGALGGTVWAARGMKFELRMGPPGLK